MTACLADDRIVAAFLGGSYARGAADQYSDLDLYLITTSDADIGDEAYFKLDKVMPVEWNKLSGGP